MKILITSYYELKDSLLAAAKALEKLGNIVINYPLYQYAYDKHDKIDNYINHMEEFVLMNNPDVILWWFFNIPESFMERIYNTKIINILFNWDEPYNWTCNNIKDKAKFFDIVFVCSEEKLDEYIKYGTKFAYLLYPGYEPDLFFPCDNFYNCDISICCTNLYEDYPNQYINRKKLIDDIYTNQDKYNYIFHIYGPQKFELLYPKSYKGYAKYDDANMIYNCSRINLCTHVQQNAKKYLNERVINILGSGGLLLVDKTTEIESVLSDGCIYLQKDNYIEQIVSILENYKKYDIVKSKGYELSKQFTWDKWANFINNILYDYAKKNI